jgi:hypothetical protein
MKKGLLVLIILYATISYVDAQDNLMMKWDFPEMSFKEFVQKAELQLSVRFLYRDEWIDDINVNIPAGTYRLTSLLDMVLKGKSLHYFIDENNNVILTLNFGIKGISQTNEETTAYVPPSQYSDEKDSENSSGNLYFDVGNPSERNSQGSATISGYITDRDTHQPVSGVTVFVARNSVGTISNEYGYYKISLPRGTHLLQFTFIGMKQKQVNVNLYGSGDLDIEMNSILVPIKETVISAEKNVRFQRFEVGMEKINVSNFKLLPSPMGESDIFKNVLLIPGVQAVGEGSAGFNVRGGSADQNLILLYGSPVYNASHMFGFFSSVNSEIIRDVTLFKGGIPARYGGRISSVMDIGTKDGNRQEFAGKAGISPVTTQLMVEGPVIKDRLTYILAGRTTYSNWMLHMFDNSSLKKSSASFYDLNGKLTYDIDRKNKIDLSNYYSHDSFRFNSDTLYSYDNNITALHWKHFFSSSLFSQITLNNSSYRYDISSTKTPEEAFVMSHRINSTTAKADFNWYMGRHELNFGSDIIRYSVLPGKYMPENDSSLVIPQIIEKEHAYETGLYLDDKFVVTEYFSVNAGARFSTYFITGPGDIYIYDPDMTRNSQSVIDTVSYRSGRIYKTYGGPELRFSLNFRLSPKSSFKVNYNRTRQYLHLLSNSTSISPSDTWKLSDYYLKPQTGDQYAAGFYKSLPKSIEASAEIYYKSIKNIVDYKGGTELVMNSSIERDLIDAVGKAYGIELMIKKQEGTYNWSIGYTYSRALLKTTGDKADEIINDGKWFPANYDKPHDLTATFNYLFSRRMSFSANYVWNTGRPITYPVATYTVSNFMLIHYSDRNRYRLPDYSRLDVAIRYNGNLKSQRIAHPSWTFSIYNLLGRENVYSVYFRKEGNVINGYKLSVFARAIPSVTYSFDF